MLRYVICFETNRLRMICHAGWFAMPVKTQTVEVVGGSRQLQMVAQIQSVRKSYCEWWLRLIWVPWDPFSDAEVIPHTPALVYHCWAPPSCCHGQPKHEKSCAHGCQMFREILIVVMSHGAFCSTIIHEHPAYILSSLHYKMSMCSV